jgi:FkbM family methyltransferase
MKRLARRGLERLLDRFEYRLADSTADPPGLSGACARLSAAGFVPKTVIDVGVGPGTPWLYASFPSAHFELFEPIAAFRPLIEQATKDLDAVVHYCALGDQRSKLPLQINVESPTSSTMARFTGKYVRAAMGTRAIPTMIEQEVEVRMLDEFGPFTGPTLLKLDVEGYEAKVLQGARETLHGVDVIISEVSVAPRTEVGLSMPAYLSLLESFGFAAINVADISALGRGGPIAYMDIVFARTDSPLRLGNGQ